MFACAVCGKRFITAKRANNHRIKAHDEHVRKDVIVVSWFCELCNEIHEEECKPENRGDALALASQIILNGEDFNVVEWRDNEMSDETNAVIMAIAIIGNLYDRRVNLDGDL